MMRIILTTLTLLALGACNASEKSAGTGNNVAGEVDATGSPRNYVAEVTALPEPSRNAVFFRAIRDAGLPCQDVPKAEQIETAPGAVTWRAQCEDGVSHLVQIKSDGSATVVSPVTR